MKNWTDWTCEYNNWNEKQVVEFIQQDSIIIVC